MAQLERSIQPQPPLVPHPPDERSLLAPQDNRAEPIRPQSLSYDKFINSICDRIDRECDERAEIRARRYTRNHNYWWGGERRFSQWTPQGWKPLDRSKLKKLFSNNQFFSNFRTILATVVRSRPRLNISPSPSATDDEEKVSAAKVATRSVQADQKDKLSADFAIREWTDKLLCGIAIRGQWYASEGSTAKARAPIIQQREVPTEGMYICADCGMTGPESAAPQHPHDGVDIFSGPTETVPFHAGYEEVQDGDCLTYGISPYEFDLAPEARDLASSPYARWQRKVRKSKVKKAYRKVNLNDLPSTDLPIMLRAQDALKNKRKQEADKEFTVLKTYWISDDEYWDFASTSPMQTLGGYRIPALTNLGELCKGGMRVDRCGDKLIDIRPELKENCLSVSVYYLDPQSWEGKGLDDAAELQRWIDDIHTLFVQIQLREALGITLYNKNFQFDGGVFTGEVGAVKGVKVPEGEKITEAMNVWSGQQPNQSLFKGMEYVTQSQTNVTGAFPSLAGSNMEGSETARGRIILREQSLQGLGPQLFLAARHDVIWAKQNLKLKQQYWTSERFVPYLEEGEPLGGRWFSASDIDTDFTVDIEADSWMPVTRMDAVDNMTTYMGGEAALAAIPGGFANPEIPKAISRKAAELLNVPSGTDPDERDMRNARHRYGVLKKAIETALEQGGPMGGQQTGQAQQAGQMGDETGEQDENTATQVPDELNSPLLVPPQIAMQFATMPSVQPLPDVDKHEVYIEYYSNCIKDACDSNGVENHPIMKAVLMLLIKAHKNQGVMDAQENMMAQMAVQAPAMQAQQAMQAQGEAESAKQSHGQEMEKSNLAHKQGLEKQKQASELKRGEIAAKGKVDAKAKSELAKIKV